MSGNGDMEEFAELLRELKGRTNRSYAALAARSGVSASRAFGAFEQRGSRVGRAPRRRAPGRWVWPPVAAPAPGGWGRRRTARGVGVPVPKAIDKLVASGQAFFRGVPGGAVSPASAPASGARMPPPAPAPTGPAPGAAADAPSAAAVTKLGHSDAANRLRGAGISWTSSGGCSDRNNPSCTSFEQINLTTVQGAVTLKGATGCALTITGGTETGHASGTYSHWNGYKLDFSPTAASATTSRAPSPTSARAPVTAPSSTSPVRATSTPARATTGT